MSDEAPGRGLDAGSVAVLPAPLKRRCGDFGGLRVDGSKCDQPIPANRERCPWHPAGLTPEAELERRRELAARGGRNTRAPRRAPGSAPDPHFDTPPKIIRWCEKTTGEVLRGTLTDYKALDASVKLARLALDALGLQALEQLDALERLLKSRLGASGAA